MRTALNKIIYHIDNVISRGTFNIIVMIIFTIMIFAGLFSIIVFLLGLNDNSIFSQICYHPPKNSEYNLQYHEEN